MAALVEPIVEIKEIAPGGLLDLTTLSIDDVKIDTKYCVTEDVHDLHVHASLARGLPPAQVKLDGVHYDPLALVCSGPSLADELGEIRKFSKILTCSGAHDFLIHNGIVPTWHMEADPREHKVKFVQNPHRDVQYLLASCCHSALFEALKDYDVRLWHVLAGERRRSVLTPFPRGHWFLTGGSNVGMRALVLGRMMGYTNIHVFGMDCSSRDAFHIGQHPNEPKENAKFKVQVGPLEYSTSKVFLSYAQQFFREITKLPDTNITLHGNGLLQALSSQRMSNPEQVNKLMQSYESSTIALMNPETITPAYVEMNRQMHARGDYGIYGWKWADVVIDMVRATKAESVLDYGCGQGMLARKLPFPIWEYDPAIPGKDDVPRPADLVICADVLEHVEPEMLENTLRDLARCTLKVGYFVIHTGAAAKTLPDGRNAHLIQNDGDWWAEQLAKNFSIAKVIKRPPIVYVVVSPRQKKQASQPFVSAKRRWQVLEELIKENGWKRGVEVGVKHGFTFLHLLQTCKTLHLTGVDLFAARPGLEAEGGESHVNADLPSHEIRLRQLVNSGYRDRAKLIKGCSVNAAKKFRDGSLDFVFIDADHREEAVRADIAAWRSKIRPGGMLLGHDAQEKFPGVLAAINDLCPGWRGHPDSVWSFPC